MSELDPRGLVTVLVEGTTLAVAIFVYLLSLGDRARSARRWGVPIAGTLPPLVSLATHWPYGAEPVLPLAAALLGPVLVTSASFIYGLSRPVPAHARGLARFARHPVSWAVTPPALAAAMVGALLAFTAAPAAAVGGPATLTKTLTAHFAAGTLDATLGTASDQLALLGNATPGAGPMTAHVTTAGIGAGGHTLQGPGNVLLIIRGGGSTATQYYDASTGTISGTAGPTLPQAVSSGGFSIVRDGTSFLLIPGGNSTKLIIVKPNAGGVGAWTACDTSVAGCASAGTFALSAGAGSGAHAILRTDGKIVIVHGGNSRTTTFYTSPGAGTETAVAGPGTPAGGGTQPVGDGALSIPRTADTKWVTLVGGVKNFAAVYDPTVGTCGGVTCGSFTSYAGTLPANNIGAGAHAIKYNDGTLGGALRWLVIDGNNQANSFKYDPAGSITQALNTTIAVGTNIPAGSHAFLRGDGTFVVVVGSSVSTRLWTPTTAAFSAGPSLAAGSVPVTGSHTFQRPTDGQFVVVGTTITGTNLYNAGWSITGTYTSEALNPGVVDRWDQVSWTTSTASGTTVTVAARTATTSAGLSAATYKSFSANTSGSGTLANVAGEGPTGNRWAQAQVVLFRPVPTTADTTSTWNNVWFGSESLVYDRTPVATPTLTDYSLRFVAGQFVVIGPASATAGAAFTMTVALRDQNNTSIADYAGSHTLVFSGAAVAPDGTAPNITDGGGLAQPFGANTALTFTAGENTAVSARLFKAETATIAAREEFVPAPSGTYFLCDGGSACAADAALNLTNGTAASVTVSAGALDATKTTISPVLARVATPATTQSISVSVRDSFLNPVTTSVSFSTTLGTITSPVTSTGGVATTTLTSGTLGTANVTATAGAFTGNAYVSFVTVTGDEADANVVKDTTAFLSAGASGTAIIDASGVHLATSNAPSPTSPLAAGASTKGLVGAGAHALQGNGGQYLIVHGNGNNSSSLYDGAGAFSDGPTFAAGTTVVPVSSGGHSFLVPSGANAGKFLLVPGGAGVTRTANRTLFVNPSGWAVTTGPNLSNATGAGDGAHSIKLADGRLVIVHAGGTTATSIYDPATDTISAGPTLSANAGAGAHTIPLASGAFLIVHGGGAASTSALPATPCVAPCTLAAGAALPAVVNAGGHAIQYKDGSIAGSPLRYLVAHGGGTTTTSKLDPVAATFVAGPALSASAGAGAHSLLRADGSYLVIHGNSATSTSVLTPSTATLSAGPTLSAAAGAGAHALQQSDLRYLIVRGAGTTTTNLHDAGWVGAGTYTSERVNPNNVDSWNAVACVTSGGGTVTLQVQAATTSGGAGEATATTVSACPGSFQSTSNRKWARAVVTLARPVPTAPPAGVPSIDAESKVWLGVSSVTQIRDIAQQANPALTSLSFGYKSGYFSIGASSPQVAGVAFISSAFQLKDDTATVISDYAGSHTLAFSGAASAPAGNAPTANGVSFGSNTSVAFTSGSSSAAVTFILYKAETASLSTAETVDGQTFASYRLTATSTMRAVPVSIVVNPADPNAAQSTFTASPAAVPADDVATSSLTLTVKDAYGNPSQGSPADSVSLSSSRGATDFINPASGSLNASAGFSATVQSGTQGTATITASISFTPVSGGTSPLTKTVSVTFANVYLRLTLLDTGGAALPTDGSGNPIVTAGQQFGVKIEVIRADTNSVEATFCDGAGSPAATCTLAFSTNAGAAPAGNAPVAPASLSPVTFSSGTYQTTTGPTRLYQLFCANNDSGGLVTCPSETSSPTVTVTATQVGQGGHGSVVLSGTSNPIVVNAATTDVSKSFVLVSPSAVGVSGTPAVPTQASVWARVLDTYGNASRGRSAALTASGGSLSGGPFTTAGQYGFTNAGTYTPPAIAAGADPVQTATISGSSGAAFTTTAATVTYFSVTRINNGTYYGMVKDAAPAVKIPLSAVRTAAGVPDVSVSGGALSVPAVCWTISPGSLGALDPTTLPAGGCAGVRTTSGAINAAEAAAADHTTRLLAQQAGAATISSDAGQSYALTIASYFDVTSTAAPSNEQVKVRVDWDGSNSRVISWTTIR